MTTDFLKKTVYWPVVFLFFFAMGNASLSIGYQPASVIHQGYKDIKSLDTISRILSILEIRNVDKKTLDKASEKLSVMKKRDIQLISSLCDQISANDDTAAADIAFSLIVAMIILS